MRRKRKGEFYVIRLLFAHLSTIRIMQYKGGHTTGFASPARDFLEPEVDLPALLSLSDPGVYPLRMRGSSLPDLAIRDNDILIVDAGVKPVSGNLVVAIVGGTFVLGQVVLKRNQNHLRLSASTVPLKEDVEIWGVVTGLVRKF